MPKPIFFPIVLLFAFLAGPSLPAAEPAVLPPGVRASLAKAETELAKPAWEQAVIQCPLGFNFLPGGLYTLGDRTNPKRLPRQERTPSLYVAQFLVKQASYESVLGLSGTEANGGQPAVNLSLYNAIEYCNKRSLAEGLKPCYRLTLNQTKVILDSSWNQEPGKDYLSWLDCDFDADGYRLPTETEWEYAQTRGKLTTGGIAEWTFSRQGSWDNFMIRGSARTTEPGQQANGRAYAGATAKRPDLGFRVVRTLPAPARRYLGLTVSDKLRVRDAPGLSGRELRQLPAHTPLAVYAAAGTARLRNGVYDYWFKIAADDQWVNAQYVALVPFFTRATGRVDSLSELKLSVADNPDIQEYGWGFFRIDPQTLGLVDSQVSGEADGLPLYPLPPLREKAIDPRKQLLGTWDLATRYKNPVYAADPDSFFCGLPYFFGIRFLPGGKGGFYVDGDIGYNEMTWEFDAPNLVSFRSDNRGYKCRAFLVDRNHLVLESRDGEAFQRYWLTRGDIPYFDTAAQAAAYVAAHQGLPTALDEDGRNLLSNLLNMYHPDARGFWEVEIGLIEAGIALNQADASGNTPLHYAASHWYDRVVAALIAHGADVNFKNLAGQTPLDLITEGHWADSHGDQARTIQLLKAAGAQYNHPDSWL